MFDQQGRGQHLLHRRQLAAAHRRRRLGRRPASAAEQADMQALLREAMEEGAWGMSTGPGLPARQLRRHRRSWSSCRARRRGWAASTTPTCATGSATASWTRSARRSRSAAGAASRPTSPTSTSAVTSRGGADRLLGLVEDARDDEGLDVTFDSYPYIYGSTRLLIMLPGLGAGRRPGAAEGRRCARPRRRERLRNEVGAARASPGRTCG